MAAPQITPGTTVTSASVQKIKVPKALVKMVSPAIPKPVTSTKTTTEYKPNAAWWNQQFRADPRYVQSMPQIASSENATAAKAGYYVNRDKSGRALYKSASTGASDISQVVDANGIPVLDDKGHFQYKDAAGRSYSAGDLQLDVRPIEAGQPGYLEGSVGGAIAQSERKQRSIGDIAARSGSRLSGQRASESMGESQALQSQLGAIAQQTGIDLAGLGAQRQNVFSQVYSDLIKNPEAMPAETRTTKTTTTPSKRKLSGGSGGEFSKLFARVAGNPSLTVAQKVFLFTRMGNRFDLSKNQKRWIDNWIKKNKKPVGNG